MHLLASQPWGDLHYPSIWTEEVTVDLSDDINLQRCLLYHMPSPDPGPMANLMEDGTVANPPLMFNFENQKWRLK